MSTIRSKLAPSIHVVKRAAEARLSTTAQRLACHRARSIVGSEPRIYQPVLECLAGDSRALLRLTPDAVWAAGVDRRSAGRPGADGPPAMAGSVAPHANGKVWRASLVESDVLRTQRGFVLAGPRAVSRTSVVGW